MATTVTTLNYLTSTRAGNTLRDNGSFSGITYVPAAAVSEALQHLTLMELFLLKEEVLI